jgi:hypothetical protein
MTVSVTEHADARQMLADYAERRRRIFGKIDNSSERDEQPGKRTVDIKVSLKPDAFAFRFWTEEQADKLRLLAASGLHAGAIARHLGRSAMSVQKKAYFLGIKLERKLPSQRPHDPSRPKPNGNIPPLVADPQIEGLINYQIAKTVIAHICRELSVSEAYLRSKHRQPFIVDARHQAIWLIARGTSFSLAHIGRMFGTDHTTVIHAVRKQNDRRGANVRDLGGVNPMKAVWSERYHARKRRERMA